VASNPFAASLSPFTPPKAPSPLHQVESATESTSEQTPSLFPSVPTSAASNPFAASLSVFTPPKAPSPPQQVGSTAESTLGQKPSLFPTVPASAAPAEQETTSSTTHAPQFALPTASQSTSLFNFSSPPPASRPDQVPPSAGATLDSSKKSTSLFSSVNAPSFGGLSQAPLSAPPQTTTSNEEPTQGPTLMEPALPGFSSEPKPAPKLFDSVATSPAFGTLFQPAKHLDLSGSTTAAQQESNQSQESLDGSTEVTKSKATSLEGVPAVPAVANLDGPPLPAQAVTTESTATTHEGSTEQTVHVESITSPEPPSEPRGLPISASLPTCKRPLYLEYLPPYQSLICSLFSSGYG
jgi:hypothetical protein